MRSSTAKTTCEKKWKMKEDEKGLVWSLRWVEKAQHFKCKFKNQKDVKYSWKRLVEMLKMNRAIYFFYKIIFKLKNSSSFVWKLIKNLNKKKNDVNFRVSFNNLKQNSPSGKIKQGEKIEEISIVLWCGWNNYVCTFLATFVQTHSFADFNSGRERLD